MRRFFVLCAVVILAAAGTCVRASEADALAIDANIQAKHVPFGTILDPIYVAADSYQIKDYTRCGDSALWTGAYLAAESFRYNVTHSQDAFTNMQNAIEGIKALTDVTGINLLARCMVLQSWPYAASIQSQEVSNGVHTTAPWLWVGNTSRDQYMGVLFGLGVAYDMTDDAAMKSSISDLVTRLVRYLTGHNWSVAMPDGSSSTSFLVRPDEMLGVLQVARHVNAHEFSTDYDIQRILVGDTGVVLAAPGVDVMSDDSYFKFNLDYMNLYNLVRLESSSTQAIYDKAYSIVRNHTAGHLNAFFDVIDRGLEGPNAARDAEAVSLLTQWLVRPRRDPKVDLTTSVAVCGTQACNPVPVPMRPPADFLWQMSPFQLTGGGIGIVENPGIDYILPYWMARSLGVSAAFTVQSAAAATAAVAPESLASLFGSGLASGTAQAGSTVLPTTLGGVSLSITDSAGAQFAAPLVYVSPTQINFEVPKGVAAGTATFTITTGFFTMSSPGQVQTVAPTLFSMNSNGAGVAAATAIRTQAGNPGLQSPVTVFQCSNTGCVSVPIDLGVDTPVYVALYGTGIRNASSLAGVQVTINGVSVPVSYAGPQPQFPGLDQVNIGLTLALRGAGESNVVVTVDGKASNTVTLNIQ